MEHRTTATLTLPYSYRLSNSRETLYSVIDRCRRAGIQGVAVRISCLFRAMTIVRGRLQGYDPRPVEDPQHPRLVNSWFSGDDGHSVRAGRVFAASDAVNQGVCGISEIAANRTGLMKAHGQAIRFTVEGAPWLEVVGVVGPFTTGSGPGTDADLYLPSGTPAPLCTTRGLSSSKAV